MTPQVLPEDDGPAGPWTPELAERLARRVTEPATATDPGLLERAERRTMGPAGTTDPRAALIRTDPGRHAANRGPAYGPPVPGWPGPEVEALPGVLHGVAERLETRRWDRALEHRCPESREGWWFAVGLGTGVVLSGLLLLVVSLW